MRLCEGKRCYCALQCCGAQLVLCLLSTELCPDRNEPRAANHADKELLHGYRPLSLHINYHPEKLQRMRDAYAFYFHGAEEGLWKWNGGEGSKLLSECKRFRTTSTPDATKAHIAHIIAAGLIDWGTCTGCLKPKTDGTLGTPWGDARWGEAGTTSAYPGFADAVFASVGGAMHVLRFDETGSFVSTRCSDGEKLEGRLKQI